MPETYISLPIKRPQIHPRSAPPIPIACNFANIILLQKKDCTNIVQSLWARIGWKESRASSCGSYNRRWLAGWKVGHPGACCWLSRDWCTMASWLVSPSGWLRQKESYWMTVGKSRCANSFSRGPAGTFRARMSWTSLPGPALWTWVTYWGSVWSWRSVWQWETTCGVARTSVWPWAFLLSTVGKSPWECQWVWRWLVQECFPVLCSVTLIIKKNVYCCVFCLFLSLSWKWIPGTLLFDVHVRCCDVGHIIRTTTGCMTSLQACTPNRWWVK